MAANIEDDLYRMLQAITINAHYPCYINNLNMLVEYQFYFDICQIIFPQLNIKLIKIKQNQQLAPGQKMQKLIQLLSQQLQIDLSAINGAQIIKSHVLHVHRFLQVLEKFSEFHQANSKDESGSRRYKSDPNTSQRVDQKLMVPRSAREKIKQQILDDQSDNSGNPDKISKSQRKSSKKHMPSYSTAKKDKRNRSQTNKNLYGSLVNIMMNQKNRTMMASIRDNRKIKNQQIIQAKNKYKAYLIDYAKQNRAEKNRQTIIKNKLKSSRNQENQMPLQDFENIQNFFKSFQFKLRDQKYGYLKRIQKLIRTQQIDRMCYLKKIEQQNNKQVKKSTKKEIARVQNEHRIRSKVLKEQFDKQKQSNLLMKKEYQRYLRQQKKELKHKKKSELGKIKDFMQQQNGKVLVNLEQGGKLQQIILDMYKRF